jgi:hypothetical protein
MRLFAHNEETNAQIIVVYSIFYIIFAYETMISWS